MAKKTNTKKSEVERTAPTVDPDERIEIKITKTVSVQGTNKGASRQYQPGTRIALTRGELAAMKLSSGSYEVLGA